MTTYVLEMRSTANWEDVRYREYTCSARKAELFKSVPKIQFTDSGHGIVPYAREHKGRKEPPIRALAEHVREYITEMGRKVNPMITAMCHCGKDGHALNSVNCPVHKCTIELPAKLPPEMIAACVGGGITSDQITHIYSLIRAALSLHKPHPTENIEPRE